MHLDLFPASTSIPRPVALADGVHLPGPDRVDAPPASGPDLPPEALIARNFHELQSAVKMLEEVGFPIERTAEEAGLIFHGWLVNDEAVVYLLV